VQVKKNHKEKRRGQKEKKKVSGKKKKGARFKGGGGWQGEKVHPKKKPERHDNTPTNTTGLDIEGQ